MFGPMFIQTICAYTIPLLFAITLHEVAHGWMAYRLGDPTAKRMGRLTINPINHIDPVGTLLVPGVLFIMSALSGGFMPVFGWAKPVPVNPMNFRGNWRQKFALTAVAGPLCNLLQAIGWVLLLKLIIMLGIYEDFFFEVAKAGVAVNLMLMAFNLIPLPPLDGGNIVLHLLPAPLARVYDRITPYGQWILLGLLMFGLLHYVAYPFIVFGKWVVSLVI